MPNHLVLESSGRNWDNAKSQKYLKLAQNWGWDAWYWHFDTVFSWQSANFSKHWLRSKPPSCLLFLTSFPWSWWECHWGHVKADGKIDTKKREEQCSEIWNITNNVMLNVGYVELTICKTWTTKSISYKIHIIQIHIFTPVSSKMRISCEKYILLERFEF